MEKVIFVFSKEKFLESDVRNMSREDCENRVIIPDYFEDKSFGKIEADDCDTEKEAMQSNGFSYDDWFVKSFGLKTGRKVSVIWDTDGEEVDDLPEEVEVPYSISDDEISDYLSDVYGFCVQSFSFSK